MLRVTNETLVQASKDFAKSFLALEQPPKLSASYLQQIGLGELKEMSYAPRRVFPKMNSFDNAKPFIRSGNSSFKSGNSSFKGGDSSFNSSRSSFKSGNSSFKGGDSSFNSSRSSFKSAKPYVRS